MYIPKTVRLLRSYFALHWVLEQTVTPTPSSAMYVYYTKSCLVQIFHNSGDESLYKSGFQANKSSFLSVSLHSFSNVRYLLVGYDPRGISPPPQRDVIPGVLSPSPV